MEKSVRDALSRWQNVLIEAIALLVIGVSAILTAEYFGFASPDLVVKVRAVVYAFGVDGAFYITVQLTRHYLFRQQHNLLAALFWLLWALSLGAFTYHNNLLFAAGFWQVDTEALTRAGVTETLELHVSAVIPVLIIVLMALIPRRQAKDERTPEQIRADTAREVALLEAKQEARAARAKLAGTGLRGTIGGFVGQAINLDERRREQEEAQKRRLAREERRARQRQLEQIALDNGLDLNQIADVEAALAARGLLPTAQPAPAPAITAPLEETAAPEEEGEAKRSGSITLAGSGGLPSWLDTSAVATFLEVTKPTAKKWMEAGYTGPYRIAGCRNLEGKQGIKVRKAPLRSVAAVKALLDASRHSKNGSTMSQMQVAAEEEMSN